jgi:Protein of unknown function (DUF1517)
MALRDRFNQISGRTRFTVCRIMLHLSGQDIAPLLGTFNQIAQQSIDTEGDLQTLGEGLVELCQTLLQQDLYWRSAANEGDVIWDETEAADYINQLFTDSAQRYNSGTLGVDQSEEELTLPATENIVVMIAIAAEGETPELETDLADLAPLKAALEALINLHYQNRLRAIQIHFSPAQFGDQLTEEQVLLNFPELIPL